MRKLTFEQAKARYVHRFTMDHVPEWSRKAREDGTFYAPQFASDREWYDNTTFPGEQEHIGYKTDCFTTGQTWPKGKSLISVTQSIIREAEERLGDKLPY